MSVKNLSLKCTVQARRLPLERFRLPNDGRKWMQAARSRRSLFIELASYANGDGTFVGTNGRNYSPSLETISKHTSRTSYTRITGALQTLGLLSWTRAKHYDRRIYTICLPEQCSDSTETVSTLDAEQQKQCSDLPEQCSHSQITVLTSTPNPSLPSEPSGSEEREREPSSDATLKPSRSLVSPAALSTGKGGGQDDIVCIQAEVFQLVGKTPKVEHVRALLNSYQRWEVVNAFKDYVSGLSEDDEPWAEKTFFADGGACGVILAARQKDWVSGIEYMGKHAEQESIDEWLAEHPRPAGISEWNGSLKISEARKKRAKLDAEYYAKHPEEKQIKFEEKKHEAKNTCLERG